MAIHPRPVEDGVLSPKNDRKEKNMIRENVYKKGGVLAIVFALIIAIGVAFTIPGQTFAASANPPKNVKITKAKYKNEAIHYTVKWSKPTQKKGYKLKKYEYQIWLVTDKTWSGANGTSKTTISGVAPYSNGKTFKVRVRAVYKYKGKIQKSGWVKRSN